LHFSKLACFIYTDCSGCCQIHESDTECSIFKLSRLNYAFDPQDQAETKMVRKMSQDIFRPRHSTSGLRRCIISNSLSLPSVRQHPSYGDCLEVKREYYQNCSVLGCVTQCSQSAAHPCEQFLQVQQIGFVKLGPLRHA